MKSAAVVLTSLCLLIAAHGSVSGSFISNLSDREREAAGITLLTEQQQAALNLLAERWADERIEPALARERHRTAAELRAREAAEAEARAGLAPVNPGPEVIRSRLPGEFRGWTAGQLFRLENGQVWAVERGEPARAFALRRDPEVELRAASFGSWKLHILPEGLWVRVKRVQ